MRLDKALAMTRQDSTLSLRLFLEYLTEQDGKFYDHKGREVELTSEERLSTYWTVIRQKPFQVIAK